MNSARFAAAGAAMVATALWGFYYTFSRFSWYDDEGYVMMSVHQVIEGRTLYDQVFTQYGPFYYAVKVALFTVLQVPVSHDLTRVVTLALWICTAALCGTFVFRVAGSLAGLFVYLSVFLHIRPLAHEPGHPQEVAITLLALIVALASIWNGPPQIMKLAGASGAVVGALAMTKISVGVYAAMSLAIAGATLSAKRIRNTILLAAGAAAMPWVVMREHVAMWTTGYAALVSLSVCAIAAASVAASPFGTVRSRAAHIAGLAAAGIVLFSSLFAAARGTSLGGLVNGVLLQPLSFATVFSTQVRVAGEAITAGTVSLMLAVVYWYVTAAAQDAPRVRWLLWWTKFVGGLLGIYLTTRSPDVLLGVGPALLWLTLARPLGKRWTLEQWTPRVLLVCLAGLQTLHAYPVAESQVAWATFLIIPAMTICIADAFCEFWENASALQSFRNARLLSTVELSGIVVLLACVSPILDVANQARRYRSLTPLGLPGALHIRLSHQEVVRYQWLVDRVRQRCGAVITLPGLNSLYFWTELAPPTGLNTTAWQILLDTQDQQRILDAVVSLGDVCVIEYPEGIRSGGREDTVMRQPLMRFVREEFISVEERDGYHFKMRRTTQTGVP